MLANIVVWPFLLLFPVTLTRRDENGNINVSKLRLINSFIIQFEETASVTGRDLERCRFLPQQNLQCPAAKLLEPDCIGFPLIGHDGCQFYSTARVPV